MQLKGRIGRSAALCVALGTLLVTRPARAEDRIDLRFNYFLEPAAAQRLHVFTPQLAITVDAHPALTFHFGYDADVVSGATPRTYGTQADAVSGATQFKDVRHAFHGGAEVHIGPTTVGANYTYGFENDYRSHAIDAFTKIDLWGKNTSIRISYAHNFDSVCDADNRGASPLERRSLDTSAGCFKTSAVGIISVPLAIDSYSLIFTQVFHPLVVGDLGISFQVLDGFQSNPYRRVRLFSGAAEAQESEPLLRQRVAAQGRLKFALPKAKASLSMLGRFYVDTWGIKSGTAELGWEQYLGSHFLYRLHGRFYQQGRAVFYRDAGEALSYEAVGPVGQYFTGDRELSPFRDYLFGLKLAYIKSANERGKVMRLFDTVDINIKTDLLAYQALTPLPPNFPRTDGAIDALLVELGAAFLW